MTEMFNEHLPWVTQAKGNRAGQDAASLFTIHRRTVAGESFLISTQSPEAEYLVMSQSVWQIKITINLPSMMDHKKLRNRHDFFYKTDLV